MSVDQLQTLRDRFLPMLSFAQQEYGYRVPSGYPVIHDDVPRGFFGIELDPLTSLHITTDGERIYADIMYRSTRFDTTNSAGREKFAGSPVIDRRELAPDVSDQQLRNLLAELMSRFNGQQLLIHITDT
ncbi:MAG: hypothetical protein M3Y37_08290 [Chloroflexota bacterium]|nr:hypothetical protein [Chloroflexota bacterium]